ncbi:hypothetical protein E4U21_005044 [Claviceps maximensis]|nr:hypothetical protein E4U21_005044 [Claviceps maximensis]
MAPEPHQFVLRYSATLEAAHGWGAQLGVPGSRPPIQQIVVPGQDNHAEWTSLSMRGIFDRFHRIFSNNIQSAYEQMLKHAQCQPVTGPLTAFPHNPAHPSPANHEFFPQGWRFGALLGLRVLCRAPEFVEPRLHAYGTYACSWAWPIANMTTQHPMFEADITGHGEIER